jgi:acyl-coenzyme A thioesterase PaaI-like protein
MSQQGFLERMTISPRLMRVLFNMWPPFRGAGIRVRSIAQDWSHAEIELRSRMLNRNYVGVHFGGSLFAMTDPFCMLMMLKQLGAQYVVWDRAAGIEFIKPGKGHLTARVSMPAEAVAHAREATANGAKHEPTFQIHVLDSNNDVVARINKTLYIRRRPTASARPITQEA